MPHDIISRSRLNRPPPYAFHNVGGGGRRGEARRAVDSDLVDKALQDDSTLAFSQIILRSARKARRLLWPSQSLIFTSSTKTTTAFSLTFLLCQGKSRMSSDRVFSYLYPTTIYFTCSFTLPTHFQQQNKLPKNAPNYIHFPQQQQQQQTGQDNGPERSSKKLFYDLGAPYTKGHWQQDNGRGDGSSTNEDQPAGTGFELHKAH